MIETTTEHVAAAALMAGAWAHFELWQKIEQRGIVPDVGGELLRTRDRFSRRWAWAMPDRRRQIANHRGNCGYRTWKLNERRRASLPL